MVCDPKKIDSNSTGLRFAEEECLKELPVSPVWHQLEPNSYSDFGGEVVTTARAPISDTRQREKGAVTDLNASGGFNQDFTQNNSTRILQGFMMHDIIDLKKTNPMNAAQIAITNVATVDNSFNAASGLTGFLANTLIAARGFANAANNGLHKVAAASVAGKVTTTSVLVADAAPNAGASIATVGYEFASGSVAMLAPVGAFPRLSRVSGSVDFTTLPIEAGAWVFLGGDTLATQLGVNIGFARVNAIGTDFIEFDKVDFTATAEAGTGKTAQIFFSDRLRNAKTKAELKEKSYQLERTLGEDTNGPQAEYITGAQANELTINLQTADKINMDLGFVACDSEVRDGSQGLKAGARPTLETMDMYNTSSDVKRINLGAVSATDAKPIPLFAFAQDATITINNNISAAKALGVLGAMATSAGTFEVGGSITAYFATVAAIKAVRDNASLTMDMALVKNNAGMVIDLPLLTLGSSGPTVAQDEPITIGLDQQAARGKFGYTIMIGVFNYLPNVAAA